MLHKLCKLVPVSSPFSQWGVWVHAITWYCCHILTAEPHFDSVTENTYTDIHRISQHFQYRNSFAKNGKWAQVHEDQCLGSSGRWWFITIIILDPLMQLIPLVVKLFSIDILQIRLKLLSKMTDDKTKQILTKLHTSLTGKVIILFNFDSYTCSVWQTGILGMYSLQSYLNSSKTSALWMHCWADTCLLWTSRQKSTSVQNKASPSDSDWLKLLRTDCFKNLSDKKLFSPKNHGSVWLISKLISNTELASDNTVLFHSSIGRTPALRTIFNEIISVRKQVLL